MQALSTALLPGAERARGRRGEAPAAGSQMFVGALLHARNTTLLRVMLISLSATGSSRIRRRRHSDELKAAVLAECLRPGASVASVAMAHGINANLVHRWLCDAWAQGQAARRPKQIEEFVALPIVSAAVEPACGEIRIELRRGALSVGVSWPLVGASSCTAWLRELLA